jgi:hypothetical protein
VVDRNISVHTTFIMALVNMYQDLRYFKIFLPHCRLALTEVSGQPMVPSSRGRDRLSRNVGVYTQYTLRNIRSSREPIGCPETSTTNNQSTLYNIAQQPKSHLHRGDSFESHIHVKQLHVSTDMLSSSGRTIYTRE